MSTAFAVAVLASCTFASAAPVGATTSFASGHEARRGVEVAALTAGEQHPPAESSNCVVNAIGAPPLANGVPEYFPAAMAATRELGLREATDVARTVAAKFGGAVAPADAPTAARQMSYAAFLTTATWPANPAMNPGRCVWVISVHAPMPVKVAPGRPARTAEVYTVAIDAGSGTLVGILAGTDLLR